MKKSRSQRFSALQQEQLKLLKIEKYLGDLLNKVNESLNTLKVEELQLKSCAVSNIYNGNYDDDIPCTSAQARIARSLRCPDIPTRTVNNSATHAQLDSYSVNQQKLNLEDLLLPLSKGFECDNEMEEDED